MGLHYPQVVARLRNQMKPSGRRCTFVVRQLSKKQLGIGFGVQGLGFGVSDLGFKVWGSGSKIPEWFRI